MAVGMGTGPRARNLVEAAAEMAVPPPSERKVRLSSK
jgi:hypothetical protein